MAQGPATSSPSWNLLEFQVGEPHFTPPKLESAFLTRREVICLGIVYLGTTSQTESCYVTFFTSLKKNTYRDSVRSLRTLLTEWHHYDLTCWTASLCFSQGKNKDSLPFLSVKSKYADKQS